MTAMLIYPIRNGPGQYKERRSSNGHRLYDLLGIKRDDIEAQLNWFVSMYRFFDAPNAIYIYTEKGVSDWTIFNCGLVAQTISLAALNYGLGSIMLAAGCQLSRHYQEEAGHTGIQAHRDCHGHRLPG